MRVTTVVLGDLGRSPRTQYHAEALAAHDVDVVACAGSRSHTALRAHPRITCHLLPPVRERPLPRALRLPAAQAARLVWMLAAGVRKPDLILVQSPPPIPTLPIVLAVARARGARPVVDWHNVGWSVLALGTVPAVRIFEYRPTR